MKKLFIVSAIAAVAFGACKKTDGPVSTLHNYSKPTIKMAAGDYYSIPVGGMLPEIKATAYDSFYNEECTVVYDQTKLDNLVPGIYPVVATSKNKYGMAANRTLWVAVTNITDSINLGGSYARAATSDTVQVTKLARGFYRTSDVGANGASDTTHVISAYFIQTTPVELLMPAQSTKFGTLSATDGTINTVASDTTFEYSIQNNFFTNETRVFKKF